MCFFRICLHKAYTVVLLYKYQRCYKKVIHINIFLFERKKQTRLNAIPSPYSIEVNLTYKSISSGLCACIEKRFY
jgi:hypothetical protein